ncbi:unnamed protein product [Vitrella brassicaformis CCMP3155]|uniref:Uncharacterized protein n=2 Tax=Vitrella brassicaformis TaxID=1169539 RepID=A0A0G4EYJ5_VITBC|nr:unnamed protein product [Vitrella brassicaformis CCMP3155]|eukprot:CEM03525.1 unnamed protein product [Vitrella brassicaformis CCMP3155]
MSLRAWTISDTFKCRSAVSFPGMFNAWRWLTGLQLSRSQRRCADVTISAAACEGAGDSIADEPSSSAASAAANVVKETPSVPLRTQPDRNFIMGCLLIIFSLTSSSAAVVRGVHSFVPPFGHQTALTSRRALRTAAKKSDGGPVAVPERPGTRDWWKREAVAASVLPATVTSAAVPSKQPQPDGVPPGTPAGAVYGRGAEEVRQHLPPLPRIKLPDELVNRQWMAGRIGGDFLQADLKQRNLLTVCYYVWPLFEQMQLQTDWRVRARPYDQDNDAISVSFLIEKDTNAPELIDEYPRKVWVLVGIDRDAKPEDALKLRLEKEALRYGCIVDTLRRCHFYKYDEKAGALVHGETLGLAKQSQAIVDSIVELLHRHDTTLPFQKWDDALYLFLDEDGEEA